jgi:hypothetical protein
MALDRPEFHSILCVAHQIRDDDDDDDDGGGSKERAQLKQENRLKR